MIFLNPSCLVLQFNLIVQFLFFIKICCGSTEGRKQFFITFYCYFYATKRAHNIKNLTKHFVCLDSAIILVHNSIFVKDMHGHFPFIKCFSAWVCFPRLAVSFSLDSHYPHFARVPLQLPMLQSHDTCQIGRISSDYRVRHGYEETFFTTETNSFHHKSSAV